MFMRFILGMGSRTLGKELMDFYGYDPKIISVSAIVQRRAKILPSAFQHLFHRFNASFSQTRFFRGYTPVFFPIIVSLMTLTFEVSLFLW